MFERLGREQLRWSIMPVVLALCSTSVYASPSADPVDVESEISSLHRQGDMRFEAGDYAAARKMWLDAYSRVPATTERWPYRVTLLSLVVEAAVADFARGADPATLERVDQVLERALAADDLPEPMRHALEIELRRLRALERVEPSEVPEPIATVVVDPTPATTGSVELDEGTLRVDDRPLGVGLLAGGAIGTAAGVTAVAIGAVFRPRAERQIRDAGDPLDHPNAQAFIDDEVRKGRVWIGVGVAAAVVGVASMVGGAVVLARGRRARVAIGGDRNGASVALRFVW